MKRIALFVLTNLAVMAVLLITTRLLGVDRFLTANGLNMTALAGFSLIMGFGGAIISLLMSKQMAKWSTSGMEIINQPRNADEAWIGDTSEIFFSTALDKDLNGNVWRGKVGDEKPTLVYRGKTFMHVSVSRDGKFWIGDVNEEGIPIYIGSFESGRCERVCFSRTELGKEQWTHAHPYLTADNRWLIFGSQRNGHPQAYGAKLKESWLDSL